MAADYSSPPSDSTDPASDTGGFWSGLFSSLPGLVTSGVGAYGTITTAQTAQSISQQQAGTSRLQAQAAAQTSSTLAKAVPWLIGGVVVIGLGLLAFSFLGRNRG